MSYMHFPYDDIRDMRPPILFDAKITTLFGGGRTAVGQAHDIAAAYMPHRRRAYTVLLCLVYFCLIALL